MSLKTLISNPVLGRRFKIITVPEWDNAKVRIVEPDSNAWFKAKQLLPDDSKTGSDDGLAQGVKSDAELFIRCVLNEDGTVIYDAVDDSLLTAYGPVHSRILRQALDLAKLTNEDLAAIEKN